MCFNKQFSDDNCIVYCSGCECSFHQNCYQVQRIPTTNFYCDVCIYRESSPKSPRCRLCLLPQLVLKRIQDQFYHISCLFIHNVGGIEDNRFVLYPENTQKNVRKPQLFWKASGHRCIICKSRKGNTPP